MWVGLTGLLEDWEVCVWMSVLKNFVFIVHKRRWLYSFFKKFLPHSNCIIYLYYISTCIPLIKQINAPWSEWRPAVLYNSLEHQIALFVFFKPRPIPGRRFTGTFTGTDKQTKRIQTSVCKIFLTSPCCRPLEPSGLAGNRAEGVWRSTSSIWICSSALWWNHACPPLTSSTRETERQKRVCCYLLQCLCVLVGVCVCVVS